MDNAEDSLEEMILEAEKYASNPYAPYSGFRVVSIVKSTSGKLYPGVNVENSSYGLTVCAERVAIFNMVTNGERQISEILVYFLDATRPLPPCGACLQVISEFAGDSDPLIHMCSKQTGTCVSRKLSELLPYSFSLREKGAAEESVE